ncbi:hypothetical protein AAMO2058_001647000 [Amorphochlora amoebiformis]
MNFLCAGLLTVLSEESAFWGLCMLIETRLGYYTPSMVGLKIDQNVLNRMISYKMPVLYRHMMSLGVTTTSFTTSWLLCLFMEKPLLYETVIPMWDYLFCFGDEILFLVALRILSNKESEMLRLNAQDTLLAFALHQCGNGLQKGDVSSLSIGSLEENLYSLRDFYRGFELEKGIARLDCATLARRYGLSGPEEVDYLWEIFLKPSPWEVMLKETHTQVSWFANAIHKACYPTEPDSLCGHGIMSGLFNRFFDVLDTHGTGNVTFKSFLRIVYILRYGTKLQRLRLCYNFFDFDDDGLVGLQDLSMGIKLIGNMVEGAVDGDVDSCERLKDYAKELMYRAHFIEGAEEKVVEKVFDCGPFGLQLKTGVTLGAYPMVKRVLMECTQKMGIQVGWQILTVNKVSFKNLDDSAIYKVMKSIHYPASVIFRVLEVPSWMLSSSSSLVSKPLNFEHFTKVIEFDPKSSALFRLHGSVLPHLKSPREAVRNVNNKTFASHSNKTNPSSTQSSNQNHNNNNTATTTTNNNHNNNNNTSPRSQTPESKSVARWWKRRPSAYLAKVSGPLREKRLSLPTLQKQGMVSGPGGEKRSTLQPKHKHNSPYLVPKTFQVDNSGARLAACSNAPSPAPALTPETQTPRAYSRPDSTPP